MKEKILLVEDNPDLVAILSKLLSDLGLDCTVATTGHEALEKVASELPDLIILDMMLPGIHGLDVAAKIRQNPETSHISILGVTASLDFRMKIKAQAAGCDAFLVKPFTSKQLVHTMDSLLKGAGSRKKEPVSRQAAKGGS